MPSHDPTRRSFVASSVALAGTLSARAVTAQPREGNTPLVAYVGTFSSPLKDALPTQVDLPPGNGRGIHIFKVDRATGAMTAADIHEMGTSPSHLVVNAAGTHLYWPTRPTAKGTRRRAPSPRSPSTRRTGRSNRSTRSAPAGPGRPM